MRNFINQAEPETEVQMEQKTKLGEKITELIEQKQLTNIGVAHMMQISPCELEDIIFGRINITDQIHTKLSYVFGLRKNIFRKLTRQDKLDA